MVFCALNQNNYFIDKKKSHLMHHILFICFHYLYFNLANKILMMFDNGCDGLMNFIVLIEYGKNTNRNII